MDAKSTLKPHPPLYPLLHASVQNRALRLATGAFRSSPVVGLEFLTNILPLPLHFQYRQSCTFARLQTNPSPSLLTILNFADPPPFWPLAISVFSTHSDASIPLHSTLPLPPTPLFPSPLPTPLSTCTSLSNFNKHNTPPLVLRSSFLAHSCTVHTSTPVYTDGSKTQNTVGISAIFPSHSYSISISPRSSSYTSELSAILLALHIMLSHHPDPTYTVFTDSLSAVNALSNYSRPHPLLTPIMEYLARLHARQKTVSICWVPAHVNIPGNEHADRCARLAHTLPSPPSNPSILPSSNPCPCLRSIPNPPNISFKLPLPFLAPPLHPPTPPPFIPRSPLPTPPSPPHQISRYNKNANPSRTHPILPRPFNESGSPTSTP